MNAAHLLMAFRADGFLLTAEDDRIRIEPGDRLTDESAALLRENKTELLRLLRAGDTWADPATPEKPREDSERIAKVVATLEADPALRYAVDVHAELDPADVIVSLAIQGKGACEVRIPRSRYDAFRLIEAIEKHTGSRTLQ